MNPMEIRRGIELATTAVIAELHRVSTSCIMPTDIESVASVAADGDKLIGRTIAKALQQVGRNGAVTVEESPDADDEMMMTITNGSQFDTDMAHHLISARVDHAAFL